MLNNSQIIQDCYNTIRKSDKLELVDSIPSALIKHSVCWKLTTEISVANEIVDIDLWIGFSNSFPYDLPDIYFIDTKYDYFPHIGYNDRKLCLFEDDISFDEKDPLLILRLCINKAKRLIEASANHSNNADFIDEINNHWGYEFASEPAVTSEWIIYDNIPSVSQRMKVIAYSEVLSVEKSVIHKLVLPYSDQETEIESFFKNKPYREEHSVLFLNSIEIPDNPPYNICPSTMMTWIKNDNDKRLLCQELNKERHATIIFRLKNTSNFGGFYIPLQPSKRKGFRHLTAFEELTKFEKKNQNLQRFSGKLYSSSRIQNRSTGNLVEDISFVVVGLGSIGSNLCYYLESNLPKKYTLIDHDSLYPENIGRHLLGFKYISQSKVGAMEEFLLEKRPDLVINSYRESFFSAIEKDILSINDNTALFICAGNNMLERHVFSMILNKEITIPTFILWLEPYGIAGHLVYINPSDSMSDIQINKDDLRYKYNLIQDTEYIEKSDLFVHKEAGCNGNYSLYSHSNVVMFLSAIYPIIQKNLNTTDKSKCYRWQGDINQATQKGIKLSTDYISPGRIEEFPLN